MAITFKDKDGTAYAREKVRVSDVQRILDANEQFSAAVLSRLQQAEADGRTLTAEEQTATNLVARLNAVYGPYCPQVDFDDLDLRSAKLFADAFWDHLNGNDPN